MAFSAPELTHVLSSLPKMSAAIGIPPLKSTSRPVPMPAARLAEQPLRLSHNTESQA
eukprot:CAMPEP_0172174248 /NCGR_PEP_ID=MMETSP1050-20130122/13545_1 /TAXON_ID=233186 /ORGANISM="Cryptomonas curvata, Strain CCAP979/52" /LENGTH=56 /DNA_ID=CAMNT_0012846175 /DNA_START=73 /DNA_END=239 /DNA_ORIENTATION=-